MRWIRENYGEMWADFHLIVPKELGDRSGTVDKVLYYKSEGR